MPYCLLSRGLELICPRLVCSYAWHLEVVEQRSKKLIQSMCLFGGTGLSPITWLQHGSSMWEAQEPAPITKVPCMCTYRVAVVNIVAHFAAEYLPSGEGRGHRRPWLLRSSTRPLRAALYPHDNASSHEWLQHYIPLVGTYSWEQKS